MKIQLEFEDHDIVVPLLKEDLKITINMMSENFKKEDLKDFEKVNLANDIKIYRALLVVLKYYMTTHEYEALLKEYDVEKYNLLLF